MEYLNFFLKQSNVLKFIKYKKNGNLIESYLFNGADKLANRTFATAVANVLLCEHGGCMVCPNCLKIQKSSHPDLLSFPEGKNFQVADAKKITEMAYIKPLISALKVFLINDIDNSSTEAQNKLLKILEEPPKNVVFLATCTNLNNVLATIKSRMQAETVAPLSIEEIKTCLPQYANNNAIELGEGCLGKTLDILQSKQFISDFELAKSIVCNLKSSKDVLKYSSKANKNNAQNIIIMLSDIFQDILFLKANKPKFVKNRTIVDDLNMILGEFSILSLINIQTELNFAKQKIESNVLSNSVIDTLLIKILEVKYLCK